jgi:hypothetical protein
VNASFSDEMVVKAIETQPTAFDSSAKALISLKKAGVSDTVITAMLDASKRPPSPANIESPAPVPIASSTPQPVSLSGTSGESDAWPDEVSGMDREVGIYCKRQDGTFTTLFGKPIVGTKTGGFLKRSLTMGISKVRSKAQLPGKQAQLQVASRTPVFYFRSAEGQAPDNFVIVEMQKKGNRREFEVGSAGGFAPSMSGGLDVDDVRQLTIERIAPRLYRVSPLQELDDGEYGFVGNFFYTAVGVSGSGEKVYDFGVSTKAK